MRELYSATTSLADRIAAQLGINSGSFSKGKFVRALKIVAILATISFLLLLAAFYFTQRSLLYFLTHFYVPPTQANANTAFGEITVTTADNLKLKAWYAPASSKSLTVVFFHGNGDSLYGAAQVAEPYIEAGYGFFAVEYRGYSGLPGKPTEAGLYSDGRACIQALIARGVVPHHIVLYGHSLGTGVAIQMAREFPVGGLMLLAPYLSIPSLAQIHYPFLPAKLLVLDRFENEEKIAQIRVPVLMASGAADELIPPSQGVRLFSLANEPKEYHSLQGRGHNDAFDDFTPISLEWMARACDPNSGRS
jgi:fermentation-respiration switch protein FrsA (DUF1100 family)